MAALVSACSTVPPSAPADLTGRLAVRIEGQDDRNVSASFELTGTPQSGRLVLTGPLGTTAARAEWSNAGAWLHANGEHRRYDDLDALATVALGEAIPIAALFDWLRGQPWAGAPSQARADGTQGFSQLGWQVDLSRWSDSLVTAQRTAAPVVSVRAKLDRP